VGIEQKSTGGVASDVAPTEETCAQVSLAAEIAAPATEVSTALNMDVTGAAADKVLVDRINQGALAKLDPPIALSKAHRLVLSSTNGRGYIEVREGTNPFAVPIDSKYAEALIHEAAQKKDKRLSRQTVSDAKYRLQSNAERLGTVNDIWYREAPIPGGVEFDLGDKTHARVKVTAGKVEIVHSASETVFCRTPAMLPMAMPAEVGDVNLLKKYVNLHPVAYTLWLGWVTYTMATPKTRSAKFVILVLQGGEGSGKSALARLTLRLIDPSRAGVQTLHSNPKDFAIAAQASQVIAYDNLRYLSHAMADLLCTASTGGSTSARALYTDGDQIILNLHVAVILNGIPNVVDQPDLAQRTLQLQTQVLPDHLRRSESEMGAELEADSPAIQRGLFNMIAKIFEQLPKVKVTRPARMIDFSRWLAAMELVYGAPAGTFQDAYRDTLNQAQLDSVLDNPLASEVLKFAERLPVDDTWSGTPSELLIGLNLYVDLGTRTSKGWPGNVISLSKRLLPLQTALRSQGVILELSRGKHRTVTINWVDGYPRAFLPASKEAGELDGY
jgi:hypothetical protein